MSGGRKDASTPDLLNGGEFLLSLLQRPHQHHPQTSLQPRPAQPLTVDPAVAAVGPTVHFPVQRPPSGHDHFPPWPQNLSPPFPHSYPQNYVGFADELRRFGSGFPRINSTGVPQQGEQNLRFGSFSLEIDPSERVPNGNSIESSSLDNVREVGSGSRNHSMLERNRQVNRQGNSIANADVFPPANFDSREHGRGRGGWGNHNRNQGVNLQRSTPPGFPAKPREGNNGGLSENRRGFEHNVGESRRGFEHNVGESRRGFEHNVGERSGNFRDSRHSTSNLGDERPRGRRIPFNDHGLHGRDYDESDLLGQLGSPSPPQGGKLHSVPGSEIEESLSNLHLNNVKEENRAEGGRQHLRGGGGNVDAGELDELHEHIMDALLEDESDDKNKKINHVSREKEYRSDSRGQRVLNQRMRNLKRFVDCRSDINRLNTPFLRIYESLIPPDEEKAKQKQLLSLLENLVNKEWPEARLYLYGSCASSFGVCKSDIDVCLAFEDADVDKSEVLLKLAEILEADNLQNVQALTRARVPIVKLMDPVTGISCDICINNVLAVVNTKLLRDYAQIDERLRQLAYIVKHWAKSRGVNETYQGTLSSYAYVLMCIHFLQQRRPAILPCLQEMEATYNVTVDDIKCSFFDQVEKLRNFGSRNKESISQLVWAFFNYWAYRHDYTNTVISVRTGSLLSKQVKDWTRRVGNDRHLICIEDPFDTSHDLGRVVDKFSIRVLREEFERAAEIMQYDPNPCVTLFEPYISSSS